MGVVREHEPVVIEEINGLWDRGDPETCPTDHLLVADNIGFLHSGVRTRRSTKPLTSIYHPDLSNLLRVYNYTTQTSQTLIALQYYHPSPPITPPPGPPFPPSDPLARGKFLHIKKTNPLEFTEIGDIQGVQDFAMIVIGNRAYISPIEYSIDPAGNYYGLGKKGESVYVYDPALGSTMVKAAGEPPINVNNVKPLLAYNGDTAGKVDKGYHFFAVAVGTGAPVNMSLRPAVWAPGGKVVKLENIPQSTSIQGTRTIVMTKAIPIVFAPGVENRVYVVATLPPGGETSYTINMSDAELTTEYTTHGGTVANAMLVVNTANTGFCDEGMHLFGVVYELPTGYLSPPGPANFHLQTLVDSTKSVIAYNIPLGPPGTIRRHIVATKTIPDYYTGDQKGYQFFFVPEAVLNNNTATTLEFNFYDSDLVADASHLLDNFTSIPACVNFTMYHSRLVMVGFSDYPEKKNDAGQIVPDTTNGDNRCVARLSAPGEPESVNKIDGLIVTPLDGKPLTNCEQFRDVLYLFKASRTYAYVDNQDEPASWQEEVLDQGVGTQIHGIAEVLDSGGVNIDFLLIADYSGLMLFNGTYARPELTWKVEDLWMGQGRDRFVRIQVVNDSIGKKIWILPGDSLDRVLYHIDYGNGLDPKGLRFARWTYEAPITSIALINTDELIVTMTNSLAPQPIIDLLVRTDGKVTIDGRNIWEDEIPDFPPLPPTAEIRGGIMVGNRTSNIDHDEYFHNTNPGGKITTPIQARIRTAYLGD